MGFEKKFTMPWILPLELQRYAQVSWNGFHILSEHPLNYRCNGFALACIQFLCLDSAWTEINQALAISIPLLTFWISRTAWKAGGGGKLFLKTYHDAHFPPKRRVNISESTAPQIFPVSLHFRAPVMRFPCEKYMISAQSI